MIGRRTRVAAIAIALVAIACGDNLITGKLTPVPPIPKVAPDLDGRVVLVAADPVLESKDPVHHQRAKEAHVLDDFKASMVDALGLTGWKVVTQKGARYDIEAKLALHVDEDDGVNQVYRCQVLGADGKAIAQIDWRWPRGTYVEAGEVFTFATHNLAAEVVKSRPVAAYLRLPPHMRGGGDGSAGADDAGAPNTGDAAPTR